MPHTKQNVNAADRDQSEPENICALYQGGTQSDAPFRYIPDLDSAFVAQVLGQVLMDGQQSEKSGYAQSRPLSMTALLFDWKI